MYWKGRNWTRKRLSYAPQVIAKSIRGNREDTEDWIEDALWVTRSLSAQEAVDFVYRHLEGVAQEELRLYPDTKQNTADKLFKIVETAFGDKCSQAQLKSCLLGNSTLGNHCIVIPGHC